MKKVKVEGYPWQSIPPMKLNEARERAWYEGPLPALIKSKEGL